MFNNKKYICNLVVVIFVSFLCNAAQADALMDEEPKLDIKAKTRVIEHVNLLIVERYLSSDIALKVKEHLLARLKNGAYDEINGAGQFASALWADLQESSNDNHFFIEFNPRRAKLILAEKSQSIEELERATREMAEKDRLTNFGFKKLEILQGNVGYLDLRYFCNPDYAGATAVASMNFLSNADAVIIDLRDTPGGRATMVQLLSSYFVRGTQQGRTHLNTQEQVYDGSIEQYWTISYVPGKRMYDMDLYVLTDEYTGSAAEAFAYSMKALNRAKIVGEKTRGSAHNVDFEVIQEEFVMHLPVRRPVNPITGTNWEKRGVEPHVSVPGNQAFDKAYVMALEKILEKTRDDDQRFRITWSIDAARARLEPVVLGAALLEKYVGEYGERKITLENGELFYQRTGPKYRLLPLKNNLFAVEGLDYFRIEITTDKKGQVTALIGIYDDGRKDPSERTK